MPKPIRRDEAQPVTNLYKIIELQSYKHLQNYKQWKKKKDKNKANK